MQSLLSPADIAELEAFEEEDGGYYYKMAQWLDDFVFTGIAEERFTEAEARADLQIALWYAYANNNADYYDGYYRTTQWLPASEANASGCGAWYYRYSVALMYCGKVRLAWQYAEAGAKEEPAYPWVWLQVAKLRSHFRDKAGALAAVDQGLKLVPGDFEFSVLRQEVEAGASLEQMEYHYIKPEADKQLLAGLDENADSKLQAISCINVNEAALRGIKLLFRITKLKTTSPYCSFNYPIQGHEVEIIFYMNEAGLSNMNLQWLQKQKATLDKCCWFYNPFRGRRRRSQLLSVRFFLDYQVKMLYMDMDTAAQFWVPLEEDAKITCT